MRYWSEGAGEEAATRSPAAEGMWRETAAWSGKATAPTHATGCWRWCEVALPTRIGASCSPSCIIDVDGEVGIIVIGGVTCGGAAEVTATGCIRRPA